MKKIFSFPFQLCSIFWCVIESEKTTRMASSFIAD
jgi:hypothetical protein